MSGKGEVKRIETQACEYMYDLNQHTFSSTGKMIKWRWDIPHREWTETNTKLLKQAPWYTNIPLITQQLSSGRSGSSPYSVQKWSTVYVHRRKSSSNTKSSTLEPDWSLHYRPVACVIAQQYSSTTSSFHYHKEKYCSRHFFYFFWNCVCLKLRQSGECLSRFARIMPCEEDNFNNGFEVVNGNKMTGSLAGIYVRGMNYRAP
jgi:hypothetical protein